MPAYHSQFKDVTGVPVCGAAMFPLRTKSRGPAPVANVGTSFPTTSLFNWCCIDEFDIIDEAISLFRANVYFRRFDVESPADKVLCYLFVFIGECIRVAKTRTIKKEGLKELNTLARNPFKIPGESGFGLGGFFTKPANRQEEDSFKSYFKQLREELALRIGDVVYNADGSQNKFWISFAKKKFMNVATA